MVSFLKWRLGIPIDDNKEDDVLIPYEEEPFLQQPNDDNKDGNPTRHEYVIKDGDIRDDATIHYLDVENLGTDNEIEDTPICPRPMRLLHDNQHPNKDNAIPHITPPEEEN